MANLIGQSIGRYHILEQLGEGGMATVFKAYDTRLERDVAIKVIRRNAFPVEQNELVLKRFEREAKALAKLNHPNIVGVIDYGEYEDAPYLVMPFFPGGTLKQRLGKPIPWQEAVRILLPIAHALHYAHEQGIIHRDVKPSNILITRSGEPMLSDFGIAKILEGGDAATLTGTGVGVGTPEYMAPEQWTGMACVQSDIYSLGVVFYELVTGRKPYVADTPAAILLKQATEPLPRPRQYAPDLPDDVERILLKVLAHEPENRYQTMGEFAAAIESLSIEQTVQAMASNQAAAPKVQPVAEAQEIHLEEQTRVAKIQNVVPEKVEPIPPPAPKVQSKLPPVRQSKPPKKRGRWIGWAIGIGIVFLLLVAGGVVAYLSSVKSAAQQPVATRKFATPIRPTQVPTLTPTEAPPNCAQPDVFCVGLVTDIGKVDDKSFNQSAWEGLIQSKNSGVADWIKYIESTDQANIEENITTFANSGYDVIVTLGFNMTDSTYAMAMKYPNTKFIGIDQPLSKDDNHPDWPLPNLISISYREDQSGFLVGALGAMMSATHKIGAVCGTSAVPPVWRYGEGYRFGAAYADSRYGTRTEVTVVYHDDVGFDKTFTDPTWGADVATKLIADGTDVIFGCGGDTGNGAILAAAKSGVLVIGVDTDQYFTLPDTSPWILTSAMKPETEPVAHLILLAKDGAFPTNGFFYGPPGFAPYHELTGKIPEKVDGIMKDILAGLSDGTLQTGVPQAKP
jgi:basic membrane protein A and related proteins